MLCPNGAGFMYVRPGVREWLRPNVVGWRSHYDWRNVDNLHHGTPQPPARAEKYEGGMLPFALICAMDASVNMLLDLGPEQIEGRVMGLAAGLCESVRGAGGELPKFESHIVTARFPGVDATDLKRRLAGRGVLISARHGGIRLSAHLYNNEEDLARFSSELRAAL
jgi:selenocysteine lyase/cysteine desulfurase